MQIALENRLMYILGTSQRIREANVTNQWSVHPYAHPKRSREGTYPLNIMGQIWFFSWLIESRFANWSQTWRSAACPRAWLQKVRSWATHCHEGLCHLAGHGPLRPLDVNRPMSKVALAFFISDMYELRKYREGGGKSSIRNRKGSN
jgi:hypothetical protein